VSSRSIEGENPLYLPQAKVYTGSCALGPALVPAADAPPLAELRILLTVRRGGVALYSDAVPLSDMRRMPDELLRWLFAAMDFPVGVVLLSGTSIVPPPDFTLQPGDEVEVDVPGIGTLINPVCQVGRPVLEAAS
jgi:2-dehydro-3-deoxy-D-arabinonate dehydratase